MLVEYMADVELYPLFQRIIQLSAPEENFAYEALIRGRGLDGQTISPNQLFKIADLLQDIPTLDFRARKLAMNEARSFLGDSLLFLNCHRSSLDLQHIFEEELPIPFSQIVLEITEKKRMADVKETAKFLRRYRDMGMRLAIDDFGSGFSNFDLIGELEPDIIKLDRSLIETVDESAQTLRMIEGMMAFAERARTQIVAEGIERDSQLQVLKEIGVKYGQGFLFGYPNRQW